MGRFETEVLTQEANLSALTDLSGHWIDRVHARRPVRGIVLDMDSSVSPTYGEQEGSAYKAVSEFSCLGRAVDPVQAMARMKRSPKRMANCALAMHHSRAGMVHSFSDRFKTRNSSFRAASSVGK